MTPQELKRNQTRITQLRQEIGQAEAEKRSLAPRISEAKETVSELQGKVRELDRTISKATSDIRALEKKRGKNTNGKVVVTEHAMLRYIERVIGIDLDDLQRKILPEGAAKTLAEFGDGEFPVGDHKVLVRDGHIVTVLVAGE